MKASTEQQLKLLELQDADLQLARLRHQVESHPLHDKVAALQGRAADLQRAAIAHQAAIDDQRREAGRLAGEVEKLVSRRQVQQERLDSGKVLMRDMPVLEQEIRRIRERESELEDQQLEAEEVLEQQEATLQAIRQQAQALEANEQAAQVELDDELTKVREQIEQLEGQRAEVRSQLDAELLAEYERVAERLGTLVVVEVRDGYPVNAPFEFSQSELQQFSLAPADEVVFSEETGHIVVRTQSE